MGAELDRHGRVVRFFQLFYDHAPSRFQGRDGLPGQAG